MFGLGPQEYICLGFVGLFLAGMPILIWYATQKPDRDPDDIDDGYGD